MFRSYIKIGIRNLLRNKVFSLINIFGLGIGLATAFLLLLYVQHERSYDKFHKDADRIHQIVMEMWFANDHFRLSPISHQVVSKLDGNLTGVKSMLRINGSMEELKRLTYGEVELDISRFVYADKHIFDFLSINLIQGNTQNALENPNSLVISVSQKERIFGEKIGLGEAVQIGDQQFIITGIVEDIPQNSQFRYNYFMSLENRDIVENESLMNSWIAQTYHTYVKLENRVDPQNIEIQVNQIIESTADYWFRRFTDFELVPLTDVHFRTDLVGTQVPIGDPVYSNALLAVAIMILVIACISYLNLATSMAIRRAKEVGIKKTFGAEKNQIIVQFLLESFLTTVIALIIALTLVQLMLDPFQQFTNRSLSLNDLPLVYLFAGLGITAVIGLISGGYPAFFISSFNPIVALKGKGYSGNYIVALKRTLVIVQFSISTFIICATLIILNQWNFLKEKSMGYDANGIITVPLLSEESKTSYDVLRNELRRIPSIINVGATGKSLTENHNNIVFLEGEENMPYQPVDGHFFKTLGIPLLAGRYFRDKEESNAVIITEKAMKIFGYEDPVEFVEGAGSVPGMEEDRIIGVVADFHFESLYDGIEPIIFFHEEKFFRFVLIRLNTKELPQTITRIENVWNTVNPDDEFSYTFLTEDLAQLYQTEKEYFQIFSVFSTIAILTACLGLFGLATFTVSQKVKEIGIRKVLGASISSLTIFFSRQFVYLVLISNLISWPLIYFLMNKWLDGFANRMSIGLDVFIVAGFLSILIAIISVGSNTLRAALANPVDSLRYE